MYDEDKDGSVMEEIRILNNSFIKWNTNHRGLPLVVKNYPNSNNVTGNNSAELESGEVIDAIHTEGCNNNKNLSGQSTGTRAPIVVVDQEKEPGKSVWFDSNSLKKDKKKRTIKSTKKSAKQKQKNEALSTDGQKKKQK